MAPPTLSDKIFDLFIINYVQPGSDSEDLAFLSKTRGTRVVIDSNQNHQPDLEDLVVALPEGASAGTSREFQTLRQSLGDRNLYFVAQIPQFSLSVRQLNTYLQGGRFSLPIDRIAVLDKPSPIQVLWTPLPSPPKQASSQEGRRELNPRICRVDEKNEIDEQKFWAEPLPLRPTVSFLLQCALSTHASIDPAVSTYQQLLKGVSETLSLHRSRVALGIRFVAEANQKADAYGLTSDEKVALRWYTGDEYSFVNSALRDEEPKNGEMIRHPQIRKLNPTARRAVFSSLVEALKSALNKLPSTTHKALTRVAKISPQQLNRYLEGYPTDKPYETRAFYSTSTDFNFKLAEIPASDAAKKTVEVRFTIYPKKGSAGKDISFISLKPWEGEVLYPPGTQFKVDSKEVNLNKDGNMQVSITMTEI